MTIRDLYQDGQLGLSIEVFPPKTLQGDSALEATIACLSQYRPTFISCTYGAGGSTRDRTLEICRSILNRHQIMPTAHFTCVGSTREELLDWLNRAYDAGIRNIMALRGDPPQGQESFQAVEGGLKFANELVSLIRETKPDMGIGVAGYPEVHQEAPDAQTDLDNLKRKVDAGADAVYTQLFFNNACFLDFRDRCQQVGISIPIIPGIMPITEFARIKRITSMCGTTLPNNLVKKLEAVQDDKQAQYEIGVAHAIDQCTTLQAAGVPGIHFYALNRSNACEQILQAIGFSPNNADCA